jgi:hypothetical protein
VPCRDEISRISHRLTVVGIQLLNASLVTNAMVPTKYAAFEGITRGVCTQEIL